MLASDFIELRFDRRFSIRLHESSMNKVRIIFNKKLYLGIDVSRITPIKDVRSEFFQPQNWRLQLGY